MALRLITGCKGAGKTALCTSRMVDAVRAKQTVYANYHLRFPYTPLNMDVLIENMKDLHDASIAIDEAQIYFDCRCSATKRNRQFSYLMLQSRKRNVDINLTSQQKANVDIRIRRNLDYLYECVPMVERSPGKYRVATIDEIEARQVERVFVRETNYAQGAMRKYLFDPHPYFGLYNSDEILDIV